MDDENREHPVRRSIHAIRAPDTGGAESWYVADEFTRIEATHKSGMASDIAYVRVWKLRLGAPPDGWVAIAEFCQHMLLGTYYE